MRPNLKIELAARILDIPDLQSKKSRYSSEEAIFLGNREVGHFHSQDEIDIRLTRTKIKKMGLANSKDPRLLVRPSSDWIAVKFTNEIDLKYIVDLFTVAAKANKRPN
jgi:hypothetical protein